KLAEHVAQTRPTSPRPESTLAHPWHHRRPIYRRKYRRFITNPRGGNPHKARKRALRSSDLRGEGNHDFCGCGGVLSRKSPAQRHAALCYRRLERKFVLSYKDFGETLVNKIDQAKVNEVIAKRFQGKKPGT